MRENGVMYTTISVLTGGRYFMFGVSGISQGYLGHLMVL
jgi:hypothetical protein